MIPEAWATVLSSQGKVELGMRWGRQARQYRMWQVVKAVINNMIICNNWIEPLFFHTRGLSSWPCCVRHTCGQLVCLSTKRPLGDSDAPLSSDSITIRLGNGTSINKWNKTPIFAKAPPLSTMSHPSLEATNSMVFRLTQEMKDCLKSTSTIKSAGSLISMWKMVVQFWMAYSWQRPIHSGSDSSLFQLGPQNMLGNILEILLLLNIQFVLPALLIPSKWCSSP